MTKPTSYKRMKLSSIFTTSIQRLAESFVPSHIIIIMNPRYVFAIVAIACLGLVNAQETNPPPTEEPSSAAPTEPPPTTAPTEAPTQVPTTANSRLPYGSICNGLLAQCNRYSETVACLQRRAAPTPTTEAAPEPTTEDSATEQVVSIFRGKKAGEEVCETGLGVDLGRCQCQRNCKNGMYVEDGEFDAEREICVGLLGSTCSLAVPNCTPNATCNFLTSKCACRAGFVDDGNRRCVAA